MFRSLHSAATGMIAQQTNVDVIANNLANVNTTGFRRSRAEFQDLIYQTVRYGGGNVQDQQRLPVGFQVGEGVRVVATNQLHLQGSLLEQGGDWNLAIEGDGLFQVTRPGGQTVYTRSGDFKVDAEGRMVTSDGFMVEPPITIPPNALSVTVSQSGVVSATVPNQQSSQELGQLTLATFVNPSGLHAIGKTQFIPTDASGPPIVARPGEDGMGTIIQGFLEASNVEVVNEMIDLIASQRAYDLNQRVIITSDEMLRRVTER